MTISNDDLDFKMLRSLNRRLNGYIYGVFIDGVYDPKRNNTAEDWEEYVTICNPTEFERRKGGTCWDYVVYQANYIKSCRPNLQYHAWFVYFDNGEDLPSHTFMTFPLSDGGAILIESSFKAIRGMYYTNGSEMDLVNFILDKMIQYSPPKSNLKQAARYIYQFDATNPKLYGMKCWPFYRWIFKNGDKTIISKKSSHPNVVERM